MTPKEKAEELLDRYLQDTKYKFGFREVRKECALIAVNEILNSGIHVDFYWDKSTKHIFSYEAYFQEVKKELEKL